MKLLMIGDVVGSPGRRAVKEGVARLKAAGMADVVVANAENAAGGRGLTAPLAEELFGYGVDVITTGDHTWDQAGFESYMNSQPRLVRPANYVPGVPGRGMTVVQSSFGPVRVICLQGRTFMKMCDCPFRAVDSLLAEPAQPGMITVVDMHAEATSEKIVMGRYLDGRVTAVAGTHTHVQTSDECVLPQGTAYITDLGMTGPRDSSLGRDLESVTTMFLTGRPAKFKIAKLDPALEGVVIDIDRQTARARGIERVRERI